MKTGRRLAFKYTTIIIILLIAVIFLINNSTPILKIVYPLKYKEFVYKYSGEYQLDPYLIFAIIKAESNFKADAVSNKSARGLMQITEKTGDWIAKMLKEEDYTFDSLFDPETNIRMGCWYVNWLMAYFKGDIDLVVAAYNCGSGNVSEWLKNRNLSDSGESLKKIPFKETEGFLKKVKNYRSVYKRLYE